MAGFPAIRDFEPDGAGFTCIHPCKSKEGQRCTKIVNKKDRRAAAELKSNFMSSHASGEQLWQELKKYAELCCCLHVHRNRAMKLGLLDKVASQWLYDLERDSGVSSIVDIDPHPLQRFLLYESKQPRDNLGYALSCPLGKNDSRSGALYLLKRHDDPGFLKIGITYQIADERFSYFSSSCGFEPIPLRQIRHVPCVRRVERLVHTELISYRRQCTTCIHRADCGALHAEWFEVDEDLALAVMEKWARWMFDADPYDVDGKLKTIWMQLYLALEGSGQLLTSNKIIDALKAQQAREDALVTLFSSMSIGRKLLGLSPSESSVKDPTIFSK